MTQHLPQKDKIGETRALHAFVRDNIRYVPDILDIETLHDAEQVLRQRAGDCDDKSILISSLLGAIGKKTRFVAIGKTPGRFEHVYTEMKIGKPDEDKWLPLETTEPVEIGWRPPIIRAVKIRRI